MNSVIVIAPSGTSAIHFAELARDTWSVCEERVDGCVIAQGNLHLIINRDQKIRDDYEEYEMVTIQALLESPEFFMFEFNDFDFGKEVIIRLVDSERVLIDDDHGIIVPGYEFCSRIRENSDFDWR